jgi:hypothetical protein
MSSKELKEMQEEDLEQEPSLAGMLDLKDPKVLQGLGKLAAQAQERQRLTKAKQRPQEAALPKSHDEI